MCISKEYGKNPVTVDHALYDAGLGFTAVKKGVADPDTREVIPGMYRIVRADTGATVGKNKGDRYNVIQHRENLATVLEGLYGDNIGDKLIVNRILNLYNGRLAVAQIDLAESEIVKGDIVAGRFSIFSDHGDGGYGGKQCNTREVCINTYNLAKREAIALGKFICHRHTGDVIAKARQTADLLGLAIVQHNAWIEQAQHLASKSFNTELHRRFFEQLFQLPSNKDDYSGQQRNALEKLLELSETGRGTDIPGVRGTAWGAVNSATEYDQHIRSRRGADKDDNRSHAVLFGDSAELSVRAMELATQLVS